MLCPCLPWPCPELDFRVLIKSGPALCGVICSSQPGYTAHLMNLPSFLSFRKLMQVLKQHWTRDSPRGSTTRHVLSYRYWTIYKYALSEASSINLLMIWDIFFLCEVEFHRLDTRVPGNSAMWNRFLLSGAHLECCFPILLKPSCWFSLRTSYLWSQLCSFWRRTKIPQISAIFIFIPI